MKTTVAEIVELIDKIDKTRSDLMGMAEDVCDIAADLLWDYKSVIMQAKVEI